MTELEKAHRLVGGMIASQHGLERKFVRLEAALAEYDASIAPCPINNPKNHRVYARHDLCERCGARADQNCGLEASASYHLVKELRRILTARGGEG